MREGQPVPKIDVQFEDKKIKLKKEPKLAIIIPTKSNLQVLFTCLNSIIEKTNYTNYKIYIADTGSSDEEMTKIKEFVMQDKFVGKIVLVKFNWYQFSRINNVMVRKYVDSDTELLLFCNNDIEFLNDVICNAVEIYNEHKDICGTIGCRLHYPDGTVQHAGVLCVVHPHTVDFCHKGWHSEDNYPAGVVQDVIGNTGACLFINKDLFLEKGGFNEAYRECFEDVELNLQLILDGKSNFFSGNSVAYHHESKTRGSVGVEMHMKTVRDFKETLEPFCKNNLQKIIDNPKISRIYNQSTQDLHLI